MSTKISRGARRHLLRVAHANADGQRAVGAFQAGKMRIDLCKCAVPRDIMYGGCRGECATCYLTIPVYP